jgi:hypothetical protein
VVAGAAFLGCHSQYLKATQTFADSTLSGIDAFKSAAQSAYGLCIARAESQFLKQRISGEKPWGSAPKRSDWFDDKTVGPVIGTTWNQYCAEIEKTDDGVKKIYTALGAYANALKELEAGAGVDADKLAAAAKGAGDIAHKLIPANTPAALAGATMAKELNAAIGPLSSLANLVLGAIADKKVRDSVKATGSTVQELLRHLQNYSQAVTNEALALQNDDQVLLNWMDTRLKEFHPDPLRGAEFAAYARKAEQDAKDQVTLQDRYRQALKGLQAAHAALKMTAEQQLTEASLISAVAASAAEVSDAVKDIQALLHIGDKR